MYLIFSRNTWTRQIDNDIRSIRTFEDNKALKLFGILNAKEVEGCLVDEYWYRIVINFTKTSPCVLLSLNMTCLLCDVHWTYPKVWRKKNIQVLWFLSLIVHCRYVVMFRSDKRKSSENIKSTCLLSNGIHKSCTSDILLCQLSRDLTTAGSMAV